MELIEISHLYKYYKTSSANNDVLKDVSLSLPRNGLVVIFGKSGSGKSTLLNIIGGIDKPNKGTIKYHFSKNHISLFKPKILDHVSFIFQHYHLLENETPFYNVILPGLIKGFNRKDLEKSANDYLNRFSIDESLKKTKTNLLSGGEKARIAIIRALITNPDVILADEPTGALDENNSINVMNFLKSASKDKLVILVTHNRRLAEKYADRIIELKDGKIEKDRVLNKPEEKNAEIVNINKGKYDWNKHFILNNFKTRFKRNLVSIFGLSLSLMFSYLLIGFVSNSSHSITEASYKHFDYGSGLVSKEIRKNSENSKISLIKTVRPTKKEIENINFDGIIFANNYDALFQNARITESKDQKSISFSYVYDFDEQNSNLDLIKNFDPANCYSWKDVIVNKSAIKILENKESKFLNFSLYFEYKFSNNGKDEIDFINIDEKLRIIGIADELDFLSIPKIYFNYSLFDSYLDSIKLENYSNFKNEDISWKTLVSNADNNSEISSYSLRCFLKDYKNLQLVEKFNDFLSGDVRYENDALSVKEGLDSLTYAASMGLEIFLFIALLGSVLILAIFAYSAYNDDKKISSILSCLGARNTDIIDIYVMESLICSLLSFFLSSIGAFLLTAPANLLIEKFVGLPSLISIPYKLFLGRRFFLPIIILFGVVFVSILFTAVPIFASKKISIKKELAEL